MNLASNPFWVLGASSRDGRTRLLELAEDLSTPGNADARAAARAELTRPLQRLRAELRWLPGVSPSRTTQLVEHVLAGLPDPDAVRGLQPLAAINVLTSALASASTLDAAQLWPRLVQVAALAEQIDAQTVFARINEDRLVAGFPPVESPQVVSNEMHSWRVEVTDEFAQALRRLSLDDLLAAATRAVDVATAGGRDHGPLLLHELVDRLAVDVRDESAVGTERVHQECSVLRRMGEVGLTENEVLKQISHLEAALRSWDSMAQPFQVSARARGLEHEESRLLSAHVRDVAVGLHNKAGYTVAAERITQVLREMFAELNLVTERVEEDLAKIASLREERAREAAAHHEWEKSVAYEGQYGLLFKDTVGVSAAGVRLNQKRIPLSEVRTVRWGATRHSVNGIPTGTTYSVAVGSDKDEIRVECRREDVFRGVVNALHGAVMWRLVVELAASLKDGKQVGFGDVVVADRGAWLTKTGLLRSERKFFPWEEVLIHTENGSFVMSTKNAKRFVGTMPYITTGNAHVLEAAIRILWKQGGDTVSGAILEGNSS